MKDMFNPFEVPLYKKILRIYLLWFFILGSVPYFFPFIFFPDGYSSSMAVLLDILTYLLTFVLIMNVMMPKIEQFLQKKKPWGKIILFIFIGIILDLSLSYSAGTYLPFDGKQANDIAIDGHIYNNLAYLALPVFLGPIFEEVVFRYAIFCRLQSKFTVLGAMLVSSLIFAIVHLNFAAFSSYFIGGLIYSFLYRRTGYLIVPILVHMFHNFIANLNHFL